MYKKARLDSQYDVPHDNADELETKRKAGQELRRYILDKFVMEGMSGSDVATLSHFVTRAGGLGLHDLALEPKSASKNGHRHVKNHAGDIFPDVGVVYVDCPVHRKRDASRSSEGIPILLPSVAFQQYITHDMIYNQSKNFKKLSVTFPAMTRILWWWLRSVTISKLESGPSLCIGMELFTQRMIRSVHSTLPTFSLNKSFCLFYSVPWLKKLGPPQDTRVDYISLLLQHLQPGNSHVLR
jgi:hypothetical protein